MSRAVTGFLLVMVAMMTGCNNAPTCDELAFYESATSGKRIESPDDLDALDEFKEMVIPEASPRSPRDLLAGCLDKPPTLSTE